MRNLCSYKQFLIHFLFVQKNFNILGKCRSKPKCPLIWASLGWTAINLARCETLLYCRLKWCRNMSALNAQTFATALLGGLLKGCAGFKTHWEKKKVYIFFHERNSRVIPSPSFASTPLQYVWNVYYVYQFLESSKLINEERCLQRCRWRECCFRFP